MHGIHAELIERFLGNWASQYVDLRKADRLSTCIVFIAEYVSLLFTDLGVLTPAAVSDELIQLMA